MSIIEKLASAVGRRDETPNEELAAELIKTRDKKAIKELVAHLGDKDKKIQSDCIKVLYELGEKEPKLISPYADEFIALLDSKNNRLQWGAMTAIDAITSEVSDIVYPALGKLIDIADKGSVITTDHCVSILIKLCAEKKYADDAFQLLLEQLQSSPTNQLPMYAEQAMPIINNSNKAAFVKALTARLPDIEKDTKRLRVEKVIKKVNK